MKEIWRTIKGFEDYEVSNLGRVKSLKYGKERILKSTIDARGYFHVRPDSKTKTIHQLVAVAFLKHVPCGYNLVVNHIDFNKQNNNVSNLEIVTTRENGNKKHLKSSSEYTGVYWCKRKNRWISEIAINGKQKYLGSFTNELEASNAYQKAIGELLK